jgi:hypothetical protein
MGEKKPRPGDGKNISGPVNEISRLRGKFALVDLPDSVRRDGQSLPLEGKDFSKNKGEGQVREALANISDGRRAMCDGRRLFLTKSHLTVIGFRYVVGRRRAVFVAVWSEPVHEREKTEKSSGLDSGAKTWNHDNLHGLQEGNSLSA